MVNTDTRNYNFVNHYIDAVTALLNARYDLKKLREQITAIGADQVLTDTAFVGTTGHVSAGDFEPAMTALDAMEEVLIDKATHLPTANLTALVKFLR